VSGVEPRAQLQRHGARFPTSGASENIVSGINKLQSVDKYTNPAMDFLSTFVYTLGVNDLVPFGAQQWVLPLVLVCLLSWSVDHLKVERSLSAAIPTLFALTASHSYGRRVATESCKAPQIGPKASCLGFLLFPSNFSKDFLLPAITFTGPL
jgi:hypothetical protein